MKKLTQQLTLNKTLVINENAKQIITTAEKGRYSYFDYSKETIQDIASKHPNELTQKTAFTIVQALFPEFLICSGLFDAFLMFEIKDNKRSDPPKFCYDHIHCYLN